MMRLDVAAAVSRSGAFMPIKNASAYLLAHGEPPRADGAAQAALDFAHLGFKDIQVAPHVDDPRANLDALALLCVGTLVANGLHEAQPSEKPTGVSFVGAAIRGTTLCLARTGHAHAHRLGRRSLTELVAPTPAPSAALRLTPGRARQVFTTPWEQGDVLLLSCGSLVNAVEPKVIARAVLETANLTDAAHQIVALATDTASLALVRWAR